MRTKATQACLQEEEGNLGLSSPQSSTMIRVSISTTTLKMFKTQSLTIKTV